MTLFTNNPFEKMMIQANPNNAEYEYWLSIQPKKE